MIHNLKQNLHKTKEALMINIKHWMVVGVVWLLAIGQSYGQDVEEGLFPQATGLQSEITASRVNLRTYPDLQAPIITQLHYDEVKVLGENKGWYKVRYGEVEGWVYGEYMTSPYLEHLPYAKLKGEEIVSYGMRFLGTPYVWGGNDLRRGVDCSGFTQQVFRAFDIPISRVSYMQATDGKIVPKHALRAGDLVFFDTQGINDGTITHVGIFIGDVYFIHSDSTRGVMVSRLDSGYYTRNYVKAIRIL